MKLKTFGKSGLRVSELCLGTMTFGEEINWGASKAVSRQIFEKFSEAGGNFIDTANYYTAGTSERMLGEFMASRRDEYVLATKYTLAMNPDVANHAGNSRKNMMQSVEASLKRLKTDYLDILYVHAWDKLTPIEEMMRAFDDLVRSGKVMYIGVSDFPAWQVSKANMLAELKGWSSFIGLQIEYSLAERSAERDLLPMADDSQMAVAAWSPLAAGLLTGKYNKEGEINGRLDRAKSIRLKEDNLRIAQNVVDIADEIGSSPSQVAINWVMQHSERIFPIIGARTPEQLEDNLGAPQLTLSDEHKRQLDEVSAIERGFPHDFLDRMGKVINGNNKIIKTWQ